MAENHLFNRALQYAQYGWKIHPCKKDKRPYLNEWPKRATSDQEKIKDWWRKWPGASIGVACGPDSGIWVLDLDLPNGPKTLDELYKQYGNLPKTLEQQTGSGGRQLFWRYDGTDIRNSSQKVGPNIDVRGAGGFVVLPESPHPSGNYYKWTNKVKPAQAPNWLLELVKTPPEPTYHNHHGETGAYGQKALADEIVKLSTAGEGTRNDTLNHCAYNLGQLIAGGELEHDHVINTLLPIAQTVGLKSSEAKKTIQSGIKGGMQYPRSAPEGDLQYDLTTDQQNQQDQQDQQNQHARHQLTKINIERQWSTKSTKSTKSTEDSPQNLKAAIFDFIENSRGSFTTKDIDSEFGLITRREKQARSAALCVARKNKLIKKDRRAAGKYHIINTEMEVVNLDNVNEEPFPIHLPFGLQNYVKIPKHAIIVLAGSSNAGKTALMIETLRLNLNQNYGKHYYMSEMAPGEYKNRVMQFDTSLEDWKKVMAASKSYDFEGAVEAHNPDGLTCIDYLEEVDGEYFKIASSIREIYDALGDGVAIIAIQKKKASEVAFGGEATVQKSRLYLVLDFLCSKKHSIICALKIYKLKEPRGNRNLTNHEMHFEIHHGSKFDVLMDWTPCSKVNRQKCAATYEAGRDDIGKNDYMIKTIEGQVVAIKEYTIKDWQKNFPNVNVTAEIERIAEDSARKPFLKHKGSGFMWQITNMLEKKNNKGG